MWTNIETHNYIKETPASIISARNTKTQEFEFPFTSVDQVRMYLTRIDAIDYAYNFIIETNPDALSIAQKLDDEPYSRGPLHGIPLLLKDNIPTLDLMNTTCGPLALVGAKPHNEAAVVTSLRKAGAVILGKANMAEWSGFRSTSGCSGWSARGGQTKGIFYPNSKASGSSGGCAVATALGLCFAAIGTEVCHHSNRNLLSVPNLISCYEDSILDCLSR